MFYRRLTRTLAVALLLVSGLPAALAARRDKQPTIYTIPLPPKPDFSSLDWIMGNWAGPATVVGPGKTAAGTVHLTDTYALGRRYVQVREDVSLPADGAAPAVQEAWVRNLSPDPSGAGITLRSFSSTGFITQYHVTVHGSQLRFDPEGGPNPPPGWLFRRVISRLGPGYFGETVEVAPPGQAFFHYYDAKLTQVLESPPSAPAPATPKPAGTP